MAVMTFRPLPVLTVFTLAALALLVWLGSWQLDRRAWKAGQIAAYESAALAAPVDLQDALCNGAAVAGRAVEAATLLPTSDSVEVYGIGPDGAPGWRRFAAVMTPACAAQPVILAEVGFEPLDTARRGADGRTSQASAPDALRFEPPLGSGPFTPPSNPEAAQFYAFEAGAMERALDRPPGDLTAAWWLARDDGAVPAALSQTPPERHLGYAVTWFLMALALIAVYALFHVRAGRLSVSRRG